MTDPKELPLDKIIEKKHEEQSVGISAEKEDQLFQEDSEATKQKLINRRYELETRLKRRYARRLFRLLRWWSITVFVLLFVDGFDVGLFDLSDGVLITLLGTTTANIIGLFFVVARYLFPDSKADK